MAQSIEEMSVEEIQKVLKQRTAKEELAELETTGLQEFKDSVANASTYEEAGRLANNFASKIQRVKSALGLTGKKGRKSKK